MKKVMMLIVLVVYIVTYQATYAQKNNSAQAAADTTAKVEDLTDFSRTIPVYESGGKRDPFSSLAPKTEIDGEKKIKGLFNYEDAELRGIVKTDIDTYALVVDSDGYAHVLREGYMVYGGYVTQITDDSVSLHIVKYGRALSIILRLESSRSTVSIENAGEEMIKRPGINVVYEKTIRPTESISIEDISIPSLNMLTLEEKWFGSKDTIPVAEKTSAARSLTVDSFSLFDPPPESWISLPCVLNWTDHKNSGMTYKLIIADNSDFNNPVLVRGKIDSSSYLLIDKMELPPNRDLFWKVYAVDSSGNEIPSRQAYLSFKIKGDK